MNANTTPQVTLRVTEFSDRRRSYSQDGARAVNAKSRAYVSVKGETLLQNLAFRTNRPHLDWKPLVEDALNENQVEFTNLRWSQKAGCSCGCSPGFVLDSRYGQATGHDYWVTLEVSAPQVMDEGIEAANDRAAQVLADPTLAPLLTSTPEAIVEAAPNGLDRDDHAVPERTYTMADFDTERS